MLWVCLIKRRVTETTSTEQTLLFTPQAVWVLPYAYTQGCISHAPCVSSLFAYLRHRDVYELYVLSRALTVDLNRMLSRAAQFVDRVGYTVNKHGMRVLTGNTRLLV